MNIIPPQSLKPITFIGKEGETVHQLVKRTRELSNLLVCSCGGIASCSTCHVILSEEDYDKLKPPEEDERDMLDLTLNVTPTSRLGCQIKLGLSCAGITLKLPEEFHDLY